ncbi:MAG: HAD hydrolase-like protein, partial [Anaerotignum sp.]|nr:HAD hydrolase-like protein [Anaerotignum sp.]
MDKLKQNIILFDLDGTLTDSMEGVIRSAQYMQEKMGLRVWDYEELRFMVGPPLIESFTKEFAMPLKEAEKGVEVFRERYATIGLFENAVFPGIMEMLEDLQAKGKRMAVATSKREELAVEILEHFGIARYMEVIGGDMRELGRDTKARVIDYVLETMKAEKEDVVMVGDRK